MARAKEIDGLPVVDAKKDMILHVTAADISKSDRKKPNSCALAQACMKKRGVKEVRIHLSRAYVRQNDSNWQRFFVQQHLRSEIVAFDRGGNFAAGEYVLQKISLSKKSGKRQGSETGANSPYALRKKRQAAKGYKKRPYHAITDVRIGPA